MLIGTVIKESACVSPYNIMHISRCVRILSVLADIILLLTY